MEVTMQRVIVDGSRIGQLSLELIGAAQAVNGGNGREQLLRRSRPHELAVVEAIDGRVGIQVPNHDSRLRGLQQRRLHQLVELGAHRLFPRQQRVDNQGVVQQRVGDNFIGLSLIDCERLLRPGCRDASRQKDENK